MASARECALYFMQKNMDTSPDTFDGNMKLQKLLLFADLVCLSEYDKTLFDDEILAFKNGCVVEDVRLEYRDDYYCLKKASEEFAPDFSEKEKQVLDLTMELFGGLSALELPELNHQFSFWNQAYKRGTSSSGYHNKKNSLVNVSDMKKEAGKVNKVISAYKNSEKGQKQELINGVKFFYDPEEIALTDDVMEVLEEFSLHADDNAYSVYYDEGKLVIY